MAIILNIYNISTIILFIYIFQEALTALKELSNYFPENSIQARRNLRSTIEKRSLGINEVYYILLFIYYAICDWY